MSSLHVPSPVTRRILRGGDRWRYATRRIALRGRRSAHQSSQTGSSIRSAWLRLGVERPKLAMPARGA